MRIYLFQVYVLLTELSSQCVYGQGCNSGMFGTHCGYPCHCEQQGSCDKLSGTCNQGICATGFFGPGCQYKPDWTSPSWQQGDLVYLESEQTVPFFLRDGDDTSCNGDSKAVTVELTQRVSYPFSWYRIVVNDTATLLNFTTTLNDVVQCSNERKFKVSDTIVDVTCDITSEFQKLRIDGPVVGSICSVYINGGRNAAAYQIATQSSTDPQFDKGADFAVDEQISSDFDVGTCTLTEAEPLSPPWWRVQLPRPYILYSVRITNRDDIQQRLKGFKLETFDTKEALVTFYRDTQTNEEDVYDVNLNSQTPVEYVKITQSPHLTGSDRAMTLCEVQTFGDAVCPNYTYGLECENTCSCRKDERCSAVTGVCAPGCPAGYYGYNCQHTCNVNCLHPICEWMTGHCSECMAGYMGNACDQECTPGFYGKDCNYKCYDRCAGACNHINGTCTCKIQFSGPNCTKCTPGYYGKDCMNKCYVRCAGACNEMNGTCTCKIQFSGPDCTECTPGYYGNDCMYKCSDRCAGACNHIDGTCTCKVQFTGPDCADCSDTFYGIMCHSNCSSHCLDKKCNPKDGHCFSCEENYIGDKCQLQESAIPRVIIFMLLVLFLAILIFLMREKTNWPEDGNGRIRIYRLSANVSEAPG